MNGNTMKFRSDGTFHILQVSDPQDLAVTRKAMLRMLDAAYDRFRPDLVLFTGDNTLGNHLTDLFGVVKTGKKDDHDLTFKKMKKALANIIIPVEKRGIAFAMIFGNHDDMNCVPKSEQFEIYKKYPHCLPMNELDKDVDCDTYNIPVCSPDGTVKWNIYMLDSAWNDENGQSCKIKESTVNWYGRTSKSLNYAPSLMFLHVPLPQTKMLCMSCSADDPNAVYDGREYVRLDPSKASGQMRESISAAEDPYGLFDSIRQNGDVRAVISGHDHVNCFDGTADGVRFIQSGAASFRCYGDRIRGVRLFILHENDPLNFETDYFTYDDICGRGIRSQLRYFWDADDKIPQKYTALGTALIAGITAAAIFAKRKK